MPYGGAARCSAAPRRAVWLGAIQRGAARSSAARRGVGGCCRWGRCGRAAMVCHRERTVRAPSAALRVDGMNAAAGAASARQASESCIVENFIGKRWASVLSRCLLVFARHSRGSV